MAINPLLPILIGAMQTRNIIKDQNEAEYDEVTGAFIDAAATEFFADKANQKKRIETNEKFYKATESRYGTNVAEFAAKNNLFEGYTQPAAFLNDIEGGTIIPVEFRNKLRKDDVFKSVKSLPKKFSKIDILINNAGNAHGLEKSNECEIDDWDNMVDSNLKGLLYVTKSIVESMVSSRTGHIINVGSIAAKEAYPKGNVYCATKAAVDKFTEGLRIDLNEYNIKVGAIHPGLVNTNFSTVRFKGNKKKADLVYDGLTPLLGKDIAEIIFFMVECPYHCLLYTSDAADE